MRFLANANLPPDIRAMAEAAQAEDPLAVQQMSDYLSENFSEESMMNSIGHPFKVGEVWYFETVTFFHVGRVVAVTPTWVLLDDCSWVHWTGRKSRFIESGFDKSGYRSGEKTPKSEFVGTWSLPVSSILGCTKVDWALPKDNVSDS